MKFLALIRSSLLGACAVVLAGAPSAIADPVSVKSGVAQLPTSGLVVDLPAKVGIEYHVSGSWGANKEGSVFDTRDVIDEIDTASGNILTGTWVMSGYFDAGDCDATLAAGSLESSWTQTVTLWGETWSIRGGVYDFNNSLGRRPAAALCRQLSSGHALLMYHYLVDKPETTGKAEIMAAVTASGVLASASKSYRAGRTSDIYPLRRSDVSKRGEADAVRNVDLPIAQISIRLPDDGYFWLVRKGDSSDLFDRMLPSLPEVSAELVLADGATCDDVFKALGTENILPNRKAEGLPSGWVAGPVLNLEDSGLTELTACRATPDTAILFGVMLTSSATDISSINPLMKAIAAGVE